MPSSAALLERFRRGRPGGGAPADIDLTLRPAYRDLLERLGDPHLKLPPVFHVAGTNGKGSTCAFLRAMLEAAGKKVHVYTSPHLVHFHERIRVAGKLIGEEELAGILEECDRLSEPGGVTFFEAATAAAFVAFASHPADFTILEVGLGGRLDSTNVIEKPLACVIARISFDHRDYLGGTLEEIAREKAGIIKPHVPCFAAPQPSTEVLYTLRKETARLGATLAVGGEDWHVEPLPAGGFRFENPGRKIDLPPPALLGRHQLWNAGLAIAALSALPELFPGKAIARGMQAVEWPARLQKLSGPLADNLPPGFELWLDGGHNDSAGEALAAQIRDWQRANPQPLYVVSGMLATKNPQEFLKPFARHVSAYRAVAIPGELLSLPAAELAVQAHAAGIDQTQIAEGVPEALADLARLPPGRILICGSLYLAGHVLRLNESPK